MTRYSKFNFVYRMQKWMDSVPGQTFLNYAYSWGASIVILGTLFKLTHLPGANFFLFLGMGTEVFVFFISAFDRPFDKTTDGMELDTHLKVEGEENAHSQSSAVSGAAPVVIPGVSAVASTGAIQSGDSADVSAGTPSGTSAGISSGASGGGTATVIGGNGGTIVINGNGGNYGAPVVDTEAIASVSSSVAKVSSGVAGSVVSSTPVNPAITPELEEATANYIDELKRLTEMLSRVSEQSEKLARDSEEMENLNRTLTGICKVYEMQLKSASSQIGTIDDINEQTRKMAAQIAELNKIYARMIEAMTAKMNV